MTETIFTQADQATTEAPVVSNTPTQPVVPPELQEIVGVGKKYQSVEDALRSVPHAQKHINTLEQELAAAREELTKRRTAEDLLADIQKGVMQQGETPPKVDLSQDVVSNIVRNALQQEKAQEVAKGNVQKVVGAFTQAFGEKAEEMYAKVAQENNLSVAYLNSLAAASPDAVTKLAGITAKSHNVASIQGNINPQAVPSHRAPEELSGRVKGSTTRDVQNAWEVCKQKVLNQQQ